MPTCLRRRSGVTNSPSIATMRFWRHHRNIAAITQAYIRFPNNIQSMFVDVDSEPGSPHPAWGTVKLLLSGLFYPLYRWEREPGLSPPEPPWSDAPCWRQSETKC
jgi:hypothetical protein